MDNKTVNRILFIAVKAAIKAGEKIMEIYKMDFEVEFKSDNSPLTIADKEANEIITYYLHNTSIPIISEENKLLDYEIRKQWNRCWIVDPLDGTKEFIKKNGEFTVNIALVVNQKPMLGIIYVPVTKELFVGDVYHEKSYKQVINDNFKIEDIFSVKNQIQPKKQNFSSISIVGSRSHMNFETTEFINSFKNKNITIVPKGSSLKFCLIAEGLADIYPRFAPTMEWDTAAGHAICNAIGVSVTERSTQKELSYNKKDLLNPSFIVTL